MDDLEFIQRCLSKDKAAWDEFLDKYSRLIYSYIRSVLSAKGYPFIQDHINDIFQEVFHSLIKDDFKKLRSFGAKNGCSLSSWLRQIAIHSAVDYLRRMRPAVSLEAEMGEDVTLKELLADASPLAAEALCDKEKLKALQDCLNKLNTDDKYFLELHIYRGVTLEDLKEAWKLSRGAVDMQKSRIMERLRECFQSKGFVIF